MIMTDTHGNGNGLNDLYIACDTHAETELVRRIAKRLGVKLRRFSPNPESDWVGKKCFDIPFREDLREHFKLITRSDYMEDAKNLHHAYHFQFATDCTKCEVLSRIGIGRLKTLDKHLNGYFKHTNGGSGGWIWDTFTIHAALLKECSSGGISMADRTCIAKAAARQILKDEGYILKGDKWQLENER